MKQFSFVCQFICLFISLTVSLFLCFHAVYLSICFSYSLQFLLRLTAKDPDILFHHNTVRLHVRVKLIPTYASVWTVYNSCTQTINYIDFFHHCFYRTPFVKSFEKNFVGGVFSSTSRMQL